MIKYSDILQIYFKNILKINMNILFKYIEILHLIF